MLVVGVVADITGGPCKEFTYVLEQFNLHWGEDDAAGSEHLINSTAYPAEVSTVAMRHCNVAQYDTVHQLVSLSSNTISITDQFGRPGRAIGLMCVCVCVCVCADLCVSLVIMAKHLNGPSCFFCCEDGSRHSLVGTGWSGEPRRAMERETPLTEMKCWHWLAYLRPENHVTLVESGRCGGCGQCGCGVVCLLHSKLHGRPAQRHVTN